MWINIQYIYLHTLVCIYMHTYIYVCVYKCIFHKTDQNTSVWLSYGLSISKSFENWDWIKNIGEVVFCTTSTSYKSFPPLAFLFKLRLFLLVCLSLSLSVSCIVTFWLLGLLRREFFHEPCRWRTHTNTLPPSQHRSTIISNEAQLNPPNVSYASRMRMSIQEQDPPIMSEASRMRMSLQKVRKVDTCPTVHHPGPSPGKLNTQRK